MTQTGCEQVDRALNGERGDAGLPDDVGRHLQACPRCRALYTWMAAEPPLAQVPRALAARITHSLVASLEPVQPLPPVPVSVIQILAVFGVLAMTLVLVMGTAGANRMTVLELLAMAALFATGVCLFAVSLAWHMRPGSYRRVSATALLGAFGIGLLLGMALLFPWQSSAAFVAEGWPCLLGGLGMAVPGALLLWLVVRRGAPLSFTAMGATLGATAGLLGVTVLQFKCPHQQASHLLVWHAGVLAITTGMGILLGRVAERFLRRA
jgi:Negative regulator of sigma F